MDLPPGVAPVVAIVGPIGSGKSVLLGIFRELGAATLDFDDYSRELLVPGSPETAAVRETFGDRFFRPDGTLDRGALGELVFADDGARARLEAIVHPPMLAFLRRAVEAFRSAPSAPVLVVEGALLGRLAPGTFDAIVVIDAPPPIRGRRLEGSRRLNVDTLGHIFKLQDRLGIGEGWADFTLDNSGSREELRTQAEAVWRQLLGKEPSGT